MPSTLDIFEAPLTVTPQQKISKTLNSGPEKGVITKGVFSLEESLQSLKSLNSLESLENGRILLCFPQSGGSPKFLGSLEHGIF